VFLLLFELPAYYDLLTHYEPMAVGLGHPGTLGAFYARMGFCKWIFGQLDEAIEAETRAIELCEASGNVEDAGAAYLSLQWAHLLKGNYDKVLSLKNDVLRTLEERFNPRWYAWALAAASRAYSQLGHWDQAVEEGQKELDAGEEFSDDSEISFASWILSIAYTSKGEPGRAIEYAKLGVQKAPTPGDKVWAQTSLAWALCRAGEPSEGVRLLEVLIPMYRATRYVQGEIIAALLLGEGYWLVGHYHKAKRTLEEALGAAERCGMRYYIGFAHRILGEVALKTNPAQAASRFEQSINILREIRAENELARAYAGYGRFHKQQGDIAKAREYLTKALEIFERLGTLIEPDKVRRILAELREG